MHGPEELLASYVMLLVAYPVLLAVETMQCSISTIIVIALTASVNTIANTDIKTHTSHSIDCIPTLKRGNNEIWKLLLFFLFR